MHTLRRVRPMQMINIPLQKCKIRYFFPCKNVKQVAFGEWFVKFQNDKFFHNQTLSQQMQCI